MTTKEDKTAPIAVDIVIEGVKPLLMHSTNAMLKPKNSKVKSSEHDPIEEAKEGLYLTPNGKIGVPTAAILACLRKSAVNMKKPGAGKKTLKDYVYSGIQAVDEFVELPDQHYDVDIRTVVVGRARILRARPLFKKWGLKFRLLIVDRMTWDPGMLRNLMEDAGKYQGLLEFRPLFGTFSVVSMKTEDGKEVK